MLGAECMADIMRPGKRMVPINHITILSEKRKKRILINTMLSVLYENNDTKAINRMPQKIETGDTS